MNVSHLNVNPISTVIVEYLITATLKINKFHHSLYNIYVAK